jgi:competence protein ComEA
MGESLTRARGYILLFSVISFIVGGVIGYFSPHPQQQSNAPLVVATPRPTATPNPTATPRPIRVYISGAVREPAVYELAVGSIVQDAIDAAGGATSKAELASINLALELQDQQHVHVPREGEANPPPVISGGASGAGDGSGARVNINTASADELETLPGVGEVTAQNIIDHREANGPFEAIEDIQDVSGIGPATFDQLKDLITTGP